MVQSAGIGPATFWTATRRSNPLSYDCILDIKTAQKSFLSRLPTIIYIEFFIYLIPTKHLVCLVFIIFSLVPSTKTCV